MSKKIFTAFMTVLMMIAVLCMSSSVAYAKTALKITKQPVSVKVLSGKEAKITVKAKGDGLKYKWYYKNKGDKKYTLSKTVKNNTYTVKMKDGADGRKVYCVVTDKYGSQKKSKVVTVSKATAVKLTKKPSSVSVNCGSEAKVKLTAKGDGLKYKWYYKNKGDKKYTLSKSIKKNTYTVKMKSSVDGRKIYCVITDAYGKTVKTKTVTLSLKNHVFDGGKVTKKATCKATGTKVYTCKNCSKTKSETIKKTTEHSYTSKITKAATCKATGTKLYTCKVCGKTKTETIAKTGHSFSGWKTYSEATVTSNGVERNKCKNCTYYEDRSTDKLKAVTYITVNTGTGKATKVGVASNGKYSLDTPEKIGYNFKGWKDSSGKDFPASGVYKSNITVNAQWELDGTNTLAELVERTDAGVSEIKITGNFTVNKPVFISRATKIYADADYTIKRDPSYKGDIFVVGRDKNGKMAVTDQKTALLNLGGGKGILTIDGNRDNLKVNVVGSVFFVADSAVVNIYDGVKIINNKKTGNERALTYSKDVTGSVVEKAGGAAIINLNSTINIYGGVIDNNIVTTEHTIVENEDGTKTYLETDGCGGAIFNLGNINMYGGTISNSEALRGGGIYNARIVYLYAGKISGNTGYAYGGGVATSSGADADVFIGSVDGENEIIFENNHSKTGGALYSNTSSPIIVLGNARFTGNTSDSGGGAIYTAGTLTVRDSVFTGNSTPASGGAIYHHYTKASFEKRDFELTDCVLENNSASLGGAVTLSASGTASEEGLGTFAEITGCNFKNNKAVKTDTNVGNGGAIYVTRKSEAIISNSTFTGNTAANNAGAVSVQSASETSITDCEFTENQSVSGGALYAATGTTLDLKNIQFKNNKSVKKESGSEGNGGAFYLYDAKVSFNNVDFDSNSAENHAGAVYVCASDLNFDSSCSFTGNSAGNHGGAFYLTYKTLSETEKDGAVLNATDVIFENNSAMAGGAISARTACTANLNGVTLKGNSVEGYANKADGDGEGGGAVYVGYGKLSLTNVTATGNTASDFGGVIDAAGAEVTVNGGTFAENKSNNGGVLYACSNSDVTVTNAKLNNNESVYENTDYNNLIGGGAISTKSGKLNISGSTFDGNKSAYYGGAVHTNKTEVTINGNTSFVNSQGGTGAALFFIGSGEVKLENISVNNNNASANGVVYASGGTVTLNNIEATGNKASNGGILYTSGSSTQINITNNNWKGNSASNGGIVYITNATVNVTDSAFEENTAYIGGVAYIKGGILNTTNVNFTKNSAVKRTSGSGGNGGAVSLESGTFNVSQNDTFTENTAENHGGAVYVSYLTNESDGTKVGGILNANGGIFSKNTAMAGGAISLRTNASAVLNKTTLSENSVTGYADKNDGDGEGGGAIYVGYGDITLNNATVSGNTSESAGGAVNAFRSSIAVEGGSYTSNKSDNNGGALFIRGTGEEAQKAVIKNASFNSNEASNGGAIYIYRIASSDIASLKLEGNKAATHGGAVYLNNTELTFDSASEFKNNSAVGHGGAAYLTYYTNSDSEKIGAVLNANGTNFEGNTAMAGGAVSVRSACVANLNGVTLNGNSVEGYDNNNEGDGEGGGAIYVGYGALNMTNVTATGNTASDFGGVIDAAGAKVIVNGGSFIGNKSNAGGAIYALSSSAVTVNGVTFTGNESVYVQDASAFNGNIGGGAINVKGGTLDISGSEFDGNKSKYYGGAVHTSKAAVTISGNTTVKNSEGATGAALYFRDSSNVTITDATVSDNKSTSNGVIYINGGSLDMTNVTATANNAYNGGVLFVSGANTKVYLKNSEWSSNTATFGGAMCINDATVNISENSKLEYNVANYGGAIYTKNGTINTENTAFTINSSLKTSGSTGNGGAVSLEAGTLNAGNNTVFDGNVASSNGGAVYASYIENKDTLVKTGSVLTINGATFSDNSANGNGGAVYVNEECEVSAENASFTSNEAKNSGAMHVNTVKPMNLTGVKFEANTASSNGGAISVYEAAVTAKNTDFISNTSSNHGGAVYICGIEMNVDADSEFTGNNAGNHGGAVYVVYKTNEDTSRTGAVLNATGSLFEGNSALGGGAISVRSECTANLDGAVLTANTVEGYADKNDGDGEGGGAVYVGYGKLNLTNVTATDNEAKASSFVNDKDEEKLYGFGGFIDGVFSTVSITGGTISDNNAPSGGAINIIGNSNTLTVNGTSFIGNEASYTNDEHDSTKGGGAIYFKSGTLNISDATFDSNKSGFYGGAVMANAATVKIDADTTFTDNTSGTGAALYFVNSTTATVENTSFTNNTAVSNGGAVYANGSTVDLTGVTASGNKATNGGFLYTSGSTTVINISNSAFSTNSATNGGVMNITNATVTLNGSEFNKNTAFLGGVAYNSRGVLNLSGNEFTENTASSNGGAITLSGGTATADGTNKFTANTATGHGGAIYVSYANNEDSTKVPGVLTMGTDTLENNTALAGGAISSRTDCQVNLTGTVLKNNEATSADKNEGGGAIFSNNNTLTLSGVTLDSNTTGFYGGAITALKVNLTIKDNTEFKNNTANTGAALNLRDDTVCTITDVNVTGNAVKTSGNGIIYATGGTSLDVTNLKASGNRQTNGGVFYLSNSGNVNIDKSEFTGNTASGGGAIDFRGSGKLTITETKLDGNSASNAGAINLAGSGAAEIRNSEFTSNTATGNGGAIAASGSGQVTVTDTVFTLNTAKYGGAVYLDKGARMNIAETGAFDKNTFEENSATADGGAVYVSDSSEENNKATKLEMTDVTFNGNIANTKGGALSTDTTSTALIINALRCTFEANKALTAGAGAVEIQCGNCNSATDPEKVNIVFTNCTFTNNESVKTTGGAVEIRTNSCAKFDGITATGNKANQNGGVIYVTSNFSRIYITGNINVSGNTGNAGKDSTFIHLYHDGKYTNPPKIYTTYGEDAAWYTTALIGGNRTSIAFNMTTLP